MQSNNSGESKKKINDFDDKEIVPTLKTLCVNYITKNINFFWKDKAQIKTTLSILAIDQDEESDLIKLTKKLLNTISYLEERPAAIRKERIEATKADLLKDPCFVKSVSTTSAIIQTLGYLGASTGIAKVAGASASTWLIIFGTAPAAFCVSIACSAFTVTPFVANKFAGCLVDAENEMQERESEDKISNNTPPQVYVMARRR